MTAYAVIGPNGLVENRIELNEKDAEWFAIKIGKTLVLDDVGLAMIGGTWNGASYTAPPEPPAPQESASQKLAKLTPQQIDALVALIK